MALAEQATNVLLLTGGAGGLALGAWVLRQAGMRDTGGLLHPGRWRAIAGSLAYMGFDVAAVAAAFAAFGSPPTFGPLLFAYVIGPGLPSLLGVLAFTRLRRTLARSDAPAAMCAPLAEPLPVVSLSGGSH